MRLSACNSYILPNAFLLRCHASGLFSQAARSHITGASSCCFLHHALVMAFSMAHRAYAEIFFKPEEV